MKGRSKLVYNGKSTREIISLILMYAFVWFRNIQSYRHQDMCIWGHFKIEIRIKARTQVDIFDPVRR